jgi:transcription-repair coupling factor (superfamily II helicase)
VAGMLQKICPGVRIGIGHGQLDGDALEDVMLKFMSGEYDVLVATTIIESGLDISNANTIFINNAQNFGLSDMHQMRGRVGRSNKKAFCYLLSPPLSVLTPEARKRLSAIEEFSDLGSGFQVAMRDLDIRGAGNLLGAEQSGFIAEIGFELYHKILDEAIQELKDDEFKDLFKDQPPPPHVSFCQIDTDQELLIPDEYVTNIAERLNLYTELNKIETEENLKAFEMQLQDRFGPVPRQVRELLNALRLQWLAKEIGFEKLSLKSNVLRGNFPSNPHSGFYESETFHAILRFVQGNPRGVKMKEGKTSLLMIFDQVSSVSHAIALLTEMSGKQKLQEA